MTTVRSEAKAQKIREANPKYGKDKLDFAIVEDIARLDGTQSLLTAIVDGFLEACADARDHSFR